MTKTLGIKNILKSDVYKRLKFKTKHSNKIDSFKDFVSIYYLIPVTIVGLSVFILMVGYSVAWNDSRSMGKDVHLATYYNCDNLTISVTAPDTLFVRYNTSGSYLISYNGDTPKKITTNNKWLKYTIASDGIIRFSELPFYTILHYFKTSDISPYEIKKIYRKTGKWMKK